MSLVNYELQNCIITTKILLIEGNFIFSPEFLLYTLKKLQNKKPEKSQDTCCIYFAISTYAKKI